MRRLRAEPESPKLRVSLDKRMEWSTVSNAADKSRKIRAETLR